MIAFSTVKRLHLPVNSLEELAANPTYQAMVPQGSATMGLFKVKFCSFNDLFYFVRGIGTGKGYKYIKYFNNAESKKIWNDLA